MITRIHYEAPHIRSFMRKILSDIIDREIKNNIKISRLKCFLLFRTKQLAIKVSMFLIKHQDLKAYEETGEVNKHIFIISALHTS